MPNIGRPSRGCQECKDRKVKVRLQPLLLKAKSLMKSSFQCDQATPACKRCVRNDRQCSGYPSASDVIFRNSFAATNGGHKGRKADAPSDTGQRNLSISAPIPTNWQQQAIAVFFRDFVIESGESRIDFGYLQHLPDLLTRAREPSPLSEAVSAVALTNLAHRSSLSYLIPAGRQAYGSALRMLSAALTRNMDICSDQTLATVLCLDFYEVRSILDLLLSS